ncbi:hypothetical protein FQN54_009655 [Arachnomyces sp. PD_36]|nr:hypothetical protein FQN54_009655 [Arachnomyces sp. PD_36]
MNRFITLGLLAASTALATNTSPLKSRQLIEIPCSESGMQDCGSGCIDLGWTCCPSGDGGCEPGTYCHSEGGCCPEGEVCSGDGGVITEPGVTYSVTSTVSVEVPTYTYPPESSSTPIYSTPTPSSSAYPSYTYPTQAPPPTFTGAADRNVGSGMVTFAGVIAGLFML